MQHVTIGACALSARTYNAEVQGSDARLRNHFEIKNVGGRLAHCSPGASFIAATYDVVAGDNFVENLRRRKVTLVAFHESAP